MKSAKDIGIIGAGIVGLAHAYAAVTRGHRVTVFERGEIASGASVRNFGMVWPIGQPPGESHNVAIRSRKIWLDVAKASGIWVNPCGSIHLAHNADEWAVLQEFAKEAPSMGYDCALLSPDAVLKRTDFANPHGLLGGLYSSSEMCVNPRKVIRDLPAWLHKEHGVQFEFGTTITDVETGWVDSSGTRSWSFDRILVCGGADFETLFPGVFANSGLKRCKLQMLKTAKPSQGKLGTHLGSGLTLRHYANFEICPSLKDVKARIKANSPELDQYGIHVMASQNDAGEIILGDSHEYGREIEPFDKSLIDDLILRELHKVIHLPEWNITERWHGIYAKHPNEPFFQAEPLPNVHVCTGTGGSGMTMSFGLADRCWENWS